MIYRLDGQQDRYEIIDFAKGFSILTIVFMHFIQNFMRYIPQPIAVAASLGGSGVHVFIFCSGFGLYLSYLKRKTGFLGFLKFRMSKIYLPYIAIIIISAALPYMYNEQDRIEAFISHVLMYKMFVPRYEESFGGQFWFISTIFQFYLVFIPLCKIRKKIQKRGNFLIIAISVSILYWIFVACIQRSDIRVWNSFFLQYVWEFCLGMIIAEFLYEGNTIIINKIWIWLFAGAGIAVTGIMGLLGGNAKIFNDIPALIGYGGLCVALYSMNIKPVIRAILSLSTISYELFLIHILVAKSLSILLRSWLNSLATECIAVGLMMVISILLAYLLHICNRSLYARFR